MRRRKNRRLLILQVSAFAICAAALLKMPSPASADPVVKSVKATLKNPSVENSRYVILVNKNNKLPDDYSVNLKTLNNGYSQVDESIYGALKEMLTDGTNKGLDFCVASAYRSTSRQEEILNSDIDDYMSQGMDYEEAYNEATRQVMPPGYSEHETGLALDIVAADYQLLDEAQESTEENKWLRENCWKYGFILRYPKDKEDITQIDYESWHFRYVGTEAAEYIMKNNITLEEYIENFS